MASLHRNVVIYDSIQNSVFVSQVLCPLQVWLSGHKQRTATIISFESSPICNHPTALLIAKDTRITFIVHKRFPYLGTWSLWYAIFCIRWHLRRYPKGTIIARGPLAGYACLKALVMLPMVHLIIQARGLLAEEYAFEHQQQRSHWYYRLKIYLYANLESYVYRSHTTQQISIEAVSPALRSHLIATYTLSAQEVMIACDDIPSAIPATKRAAWSRDSRALLGIPAKAYVYCYNGSAKPWQCPAIFFTFCKEKIASDPNAHLLIITQDSEEFATMLPATTIPYERCHIVSAEHQEVYYYLAAANSGLIFRDATLLNWVSRPTKVLEYHAAGLHIIHNKTIAWLIESARNQQPYEVSCRYAQMMNVTSASVHNTP